MFNKFKDNLLILWNSRIIYLFAAFLILFSILVHRVFSLQIVNGENYLNNFQLQIKKERTIDAARGNIYDRNGVLLAYNQLAYSVKIEDVYESGKNKNALLNKTIKKTIEIIEKYGDEITNDFNIYLDDYNRYQFSLSGTRLDRFKADVYGCRFIDEMTYLQSSSSASDIIDFLSGESMYNIDKTDLSKDMILKITAIRYAMSANAYQKYISTTIANDVCDQTVAVILENNDILQGVSISEDTIRVYPNGKYTSHIIGYTGKISSDELEELKKEDDSYSSNDIIGKIGIEASMESVLKGIKGSETVFVDTMGKVIMSDEYTAAIAGNDLYLTIDSNLQEAVYNILEQKIAGIILMKLTNEKEYIPKENASSSDILIPIYDVYYTLFDNEVIDLNHLSSKDATENEKTAYNAFLNKKSEVLDWINNELTTQKTAYKKLKIEYQVYQNYVEDTLLNIGVLNNSLIDKSDSTYKAWAIDETISLNDYLNYAISKNWVDEQYLDLDEAYTNSEEIFKAILSVLNSSLSEDEEFDKILYKYVVKGDRIRPSVICNILLDQGIVTLSDEEMNAWQRGAISPYSFMVKRIENLEITPAMLALDPYSASMVITDVNTGEVLALVSYPSYDNNYMANGADSAYLKKINSDKSKPMINYATQQKTAPGSTFKMVSSVAGLCEGVINTNSLITCLGQFDEITDIHKCWVYPGRHGPLNVSGAIKKSCNYFFYTVGYRLSLDEDGKYNSKLGTDTLAKYADMFGLSEKSGIEIEESLPTVSDMYSVPSAIGQGTNNYTTVGLARYVTAVANSGTVFNLSLLKKLTDSEGNIIKEYSPSVRNTVDIDEKYWNAIHAGMRGVVEDKSYFNGFPINVAGKTGTAQQSRAKADHGLFVCYAPYESPKISIAVRIANGYSSEYAAATTKDVLSYYFNLKDDEDIVTGTATELGVTSLSGD